VIADAKPYSKYKESGLPWVRKVPGHWELVPNRGLVRRIKVLVGKRHRDYRLLSLTKQGVILRDLSSGKGKFSADMGTSQEVRGGDFVFCFFDVPETPRTVGLSRHDGMITGAYTVFKWLGNGVAEYFELFYQALDDRKLLSPLYSGLRNTIPVDRFLVSKTPQPPPDEQAAIVSFLRWTNGRLEHAIRAKRKVISLLNEQRQTIIDRAVTSGVRTATLVRRSGIAWLDQMPGKWQTRRLKSLLARADYGTSEFVSGEGRIRVLGMGHIRDGRVVLPAKGGLHVIPPGLLLERNDLLFNRTNSPELVGKVGIFLGDATDEVTFASYLVRLRVRPEYNPAWLNYLLNSTSFWRYARSQALVSLHQANLNSTRYGQMVLPVPDTREEQDEIVEHIRANTHRIEVTISRMEREIALLTEYRKTLTMDVVSGMLDVREAVADLPDERSLDNSEFVDMPEYAEADEENAVA
jgi:type I restriction enzyme, S subunit